MIHDLQLDLLFILAWVRLLLRPDEVHSEPGLKSGRARLRLKEDAPNASLASVHRLKIVVVMHFGRTVWSVKDDVSR